MTTSHIETVLRLKVTKHQACRFFLVDVGESLKATLLFVFLPLYSTRTGEEHRRMGNKKEDTV